MSYKPSFNEPKKNLSNPFSGGSNPFSFSPKQNDPPKNVLFPTNQTYHKFNPFSGPETKEKTPEKKGLFANISTQPLFPSTKTENYPFFQPETKTNPQNLFEFTKKQQINPTSIQNEVTELLQLKKDNNLQKEMMEQMLKRIKELESRNIELETQKNELLQRNIQLENAMKNYQQQGIKPSSLPNITVNQPNQPAIVQNPQIHTQLPIPITKSMPIHFDYSKKDEIFPKSYPVSIFNEDEIIPSAFTEKTFLTVDGYAFQAYVAFNAFYAIKYIILQKIKNKYGYLNLTESTVDNLKNQLKDQKEKNWYLFHPNSSRNVLTQNVIDELTNSIVDQMRKGENNPININITMSKYISMTESHCTIYHPDWTISSAFELELYNYLNFNGSNQDTKNIIKQNIDEWIKQKTTEHEQKKSTHELVMWFDDKMGSFHIYWSSRTHSP